MNKLKWSNMNRLNIFLILFVCLTGCSASLAVKEKAQQTLNGECYELFTKSGIGTYQQCSNALANVRCAFALSIEKNNSQFCGYATRMELNDGLCLKDCTATWEQIEALALTRCEAMKKSHNSTNTNACKVFARNNEIIWNGSQSGDIKFQ
jgi:hypothetical protein